MAEIRNLMSQLQNKASSWISGIAWQAWESLLPCIPWIVAGAVLVLTGAILHVIVRIRRDRFLHGATMRTVDAMDGIEFEHFLVGLFGHMGYRVQHVGGSHDYGADLVLVSHGKRIVVQAKRYAGNVGIGAVQELLGALHYYDGARGIVVTSGGYTESARRLAACSGIELWDRGRLAASMRGAMHPRNRRRVEPVYNETKG